MSIDKTVAEDEFWTIEQHRNRVSDILAATKNVYDLLTKIEGVFDNTHAKKIPNRIVDLYDKVTAMPKIFYGHVQGLSDLTKYPLSKQEVTSNTKMKRTHKVPPMVGSIAQSSDSARALIRCIVPYRSDIDEAVNAVFRIHYGGRFIGDHLFDEATDSTVQRYRSRVLHLWYPRSEQKAS